MRPLPDLLAEARRAAGLSLAEVAARLADLLPDGLTRGAVHHYERGTRPPPADVLHALARIYGGELAATPAGWVWRPKKTSRKMSTRG